MEEYVKSELNTKIFKKCGTMSGCINTGNIYETDTGKVFLKKNSRLEAKVMLEGEYESLRKILKTKTVKVPEPLLVGGIGKEYFVVLEFINMKPLRKFNSHLGESLAKLHLHNLNDIKTCSNSENFVHFKELPAKKFGFHVSTSCGYIPQDNEWSEDWVAFYIRQKLQPQIEMILENYGNREISELWSQLQIKIPFFFKNIEIQPSLLHGDLWIGNSGETNESSVIFDPASFYGHHEYDLAIATMFGGFGKNFFDSYNSLIPKAKGFQQRHELYTLFHHLNHWNHFGSHRESSLQIMRSLVK